jgi:Fe/S biogenesis protein NfuA
VRGRLQQQHGQQSRRGDEFVDGTEDGLRGQVPGAEASLIDRIRYVIESEINPQLASHGGRVSLREVTAEGIVVLQFGGGCHGCGMVDKTLRGGVETTLKMRVPEVTGVADATDHATGSRPYYRGEARG